MTQAVPVFVVGNGVCQVVAWLERMEPLPATGQTNRQTGSSASDVQYTSLPLLAVSGIKRNNLCGLL